MSQHAYLQKILYQALANPRGILVHVYDPVKVRQKFYAAKYTANDSALAGLDIKHAPDGTCPPDQGDGWGHLVIYPRGAIAERAEALAPPKQITPQQGIKASLFSDLSAEELGFSDDDVAEITAEGGQGSKVPGRMSTSDDGSNEGD